MNEKSGAAHGAACGRAARAAALPGIILAGIILAATACGSGTPGAAPLAGRSAYQQAVAYVQCMRAHGEPDFPPPSSQGGINLGPVDIHSPQYLTAQRACAHVFSGPPLTTAEEHQHVSMALTFAACMRAHGLPDFPEPTVVRGGAAIGFGLGRVDQHSPQFRSALQACRRYEPGLAGGAP